MPRLEEIFSLLPKQLTESFMDGKCVPPRPYKKFVAQSVVVIADLSGFSTFANLQSRR